MNQELEDMKEVTSFNSCTKVQHEHISNITKERYCERRDISEDDIFQKSLEQISR